ncbi:ABC transporter permease [Streptococcus uberis]|uniref:ABC transporter permease n=1 Tax=Streptococcus uberis TaxID=1349 RepID=UPI0006204525|nr:ABC transporter permease [Streptococcus uberis]KKF46687.1 multidrug ABC transporter permease [Streptococcus uberis S6261]KKF51904.1 multidrug ABC transporter permease [Streptococcus uberis B190]
MKQLFAERKRAFQKKQLKYLKYVFNDHFVLVLLFLTGYVLFEYSKLLKNFPKNPIIILLALALVVLILWPLGKTATYLEKADSQFLLPQEKAVVEHIHHSTKVSFSQWTLLAIVILIVLLPLFLKSGFTFWGFLLLLAIFTVAKWFIHHWKNTALLKGNDLDWEKAIETEHGRKQGLLKFYSLFTQVKGISSSFKARPYLNGLLKLIGKKPEHLWLNLYLRAFLRGSDYLGIFVRLTTLSCLALLFISNTYLALALACLFNYLLLFQLLALYHHFDYYGLNLLYPSSKPVKVSNLLTFLKGLSLIIFVVEIIINHHLVVVFGLAILLLFLNLIYLPHKLKNIID